MATDYTGVNNSDDCQAELCMLARPDISTVHIVISVGRHHRGMAQQEAVLSIRAVKLSPPSEILSCQLVKNQEWPV